MQTLGSSHGRGEETVAGLPGYTLLGQQQAHGVMQQVPRGSWAVGPSSQSSSPMESCVSQAQVGPEGRGPPLAPYRWIHLFQLTSGGNTQPSRKVHSSVGS